MQHKLCPSCEGWQAHPDDRVCGNCGDVLLKANVNIIPSVIYDDIAPPDNIQIIVTKKNGNLEGTEFIWRRTRDRKEISLDGISFTSITDNDDPIDLKYPFDELEDDKNQVDTWELIHLIMEDYERVLGTLNIGRSRPELLLDKIDIILVDEQSNVTLHLTNHKGDCFNISELFITLPDRSISTDLPLIPDDIGGLTLYEGETTAIQLNLPKALIKQLHEIPTGVSLLLNIKSKDLPGEETVVEPPPEFRIRVSKPALPKIRTDNKKIRVLQNGIIILPVTIENRGGEPCTIIGIDLQIVIREKEPICIPTDIEPITLDIGESQEKLLSATLEDINLPQGIYFLIMSMVTDDSELSDQTKIELHIVKPSPYEGIIVIDFGTTASAAACYNRIGNPQIIHLSDDRKLTYIPTAIAYYLNSKNELKSCIGKKAVEKFQQLPADRIRFLDNLKWRLNETTPILLPDGTTKQWWEASADYLKDIKKRIENHPKVVAIVEKVCITQPARFDPQMSSLLYQSYKISGMQPMIIHSDNKPVKAILESWPASMLSLQGDEILTWQQYYLSNNWKPSNEKYLWLNFDMGGGSTDLSLMTIDIAGFDHMQVKEIACDGDNEIAGNLISSLIYKHISFVDTEKENPEKQEEGLEISMDNYPIILPWGDNAKDTNDNDTAILNGHRIAENIIFPLQQYSDTAPGIIQETYDSIFRTESTSVQKDIMKLWLDSKLLDQGSIKNVIHNFSETVKYNVEENPGFHLSATLRSIHGAEKEFLPGQVRFNTRAFLEDFITKVSIPLYEKVKSILSMASNSDNQERKLLLISTGRGAMFPMITSAIDAYFEALKKQMPGHTKSDIQGITGSKAKTIVCEGACHIGHLLSQSIEFNSISFEPLPDPAFGFLKGKDIETGFYNFEPLAHGIIKPEDGWFSTEYPVRNGEHDLNITFCQNLENKEKFIPKDENRYYIRGRINFSPDKAKNTHLLIRMLEDGKLEASIGLPPENEEGENSQNHDQWQKQILGTYQLLPIVQVHTLSD